jgi:hypothetical protein
MQNHIHTSFENAENYRPLTIKKSKPKETESKETENQNISKKIEQLCARILTPEYLEQKAKNFILAKISPFTSPDEFKTKIKPIKKDLRLLNKLKADREHKLMQINQMLENQVSKSQRNFLIEQKINLQNQNLRFIEAFEQTKAHLNYLKNLNKLQIGGRLTWHAGMIANFILPGSGVVLGTALTAANTIAQEKLAAFFPAKEKVVIEERKNVRFSTWTTIACMTTSVFLGIYIIPSIKSAAGHLWNKLL